MSELRRQLESARSAYQQVRYAGDLGELAMAEPAPKKRPGRKLVAWGVAIAASLVGVVALLPEEPAARPKPKLRLAEAVRTSPLNSPRPPLLKQMANASRRDTPRKKRVKLSLASIPTPRVATLRPKPTAVASTGVTARTPTPPATPRRRDLSTPSLTLRSLNDAISLGT